MLPENASGLPDSMDAQTRKVSLGISAFLSLNGVQELGVELTLSKETEGYNDEPGRRLSVLGDAAVEKTRLV
jgi:hypothetical protein